MLSVCVAALAFSGCGGGSTGAAASRRSPPLPRPRAASSPSTAASSAATAAAPTADGQFRRRRISPLERRAVSSGAINAWNAGGRGQNVNVAVIDSGINPSLAEFAGRIHPASADMVANRGVTDTKGMAPPSPRCIAAARNGAGPMGVAFEATILSLNTADPTDCDPDDGCQHNDRDIADGDRRRADQRRAGDQHLAGRRRHHAMR